MKKLLLWGMFGVISTAQAVTFSSPKEGYSLTAPAGWRQSTYSGASVVFMAPKSLENFHPNVNVLVQPLPQKITLKQYHDISVAQIGELMVGGKVMSVKNTTLGGVPAYDVTYQGKQGNYKLLFEVIYAVKGQRAYVVTATTLFDQPATLPPLKQFVSGFKFLP